MPTFLSDPSPAFTFILLLVALVAVGIWYRFRDKTSRNRMIAVVAIVLVVLLIGQLVDSPREIAVQKTQDAGVAANKRDWPAAFAVFSDKFQYAGKDKAGFQRTVAELAKQYDGSVNLKDFDRATAEYIGSDQVRIGFIAQVSWKAGGGETGPLPFYVETTFQKEADGQYRIVTVELYNYAKRKQGPPEKIPGF